MKVLLINTVPLETNGISTFIINSAEVMVKKGINVTVTAPNKVNAKLKNDLMEKNISVVEIRNRMSNPLHYFIRLKKLLSEYRYDVVHVNGNSTTMAIELLAAKQASVKLRIAHSHNTTTEHPFINRILRPVFEKNINGRLACNDAAGKWLFKDQKYKVIKNGIFLNKYAFTSSIRKNIRNKYRVLDDEVLIGHVGMFNYQKNQKFFIDILKNMDSHYKLMLVGDGPKFDEIKAQVLENGLENRIIFTGAVDNVTEYLNAFDIFALPSLFEGQPFVIIEALASGLPIVVSDKVSREIDLTKSIQFVSLAETLEWESVLAKLKIDDSQRKFDSINNRRILQDKGYDVESNVGNSLLSFYSHNLN